MIKGWPYLPFELHGIVLPVVAGQPVSCTCDGEPVQAQVEAQGGLAFCVEVRIQGFHRGEGDKVVPDRFDSIVVPFCVNRDGTAETFQRTPRRK